MGPGRMKKGLLSSATFQIIFQAVQFICCDLQMIYDQSFFNKEKKTRVSYINNINYCQI
jgi:hypothetical protein